MAAPDSFRSKPHVLGDITLMGRLVQDRIGLLLEPFDLTHTQAVLLVRLWRAPGASLPQTALIESLAVSRAFGTQLLQELEARGLVGRNQDRVDARRQWVSLTKAGRDLEASVLGVFEQVEQEIVGGVTEDQQSLLGTALAGMLDRARAGRDRGR